MTKKQVIRFARAIVPPPWIFGGIMQTMVSPPPFTMAELRDILNDIAARMDLMHMSTLIITAIPKEPGLMRLYFLIGGKCVDPVTDVDIFEDWKREWEEWAGTEVDLTPIAAWNTEGAMEFLKVHLDRAQNYAVELWTSFGRFESSDTHSLVRQWDSVCDSLLRR